MAKPMPQAGERYSAKEVLEILHFGQYTFPYGDDDSDDGYESDEFSLSTSKEEQEKSPEFIPPSPKSKILPRKRMKILPKCKKEPVNGKGENVIRKEQHEPIITKQQVQRIQQPVKIQQKTVTLSTEGKKERIAINNCDSVQRRKKRTNCN